MKLDQWIPSDYLKIGDVVRIDKELTSSDETLRVPLPVGSSGVVVKIDEDSDA